LKELLEKAGGGRFYAISTIDLEEEWGSLNETETKGLRIEKLKDGLYGVYLIESQAEEG
jgi:hypothetical protein